MLLYLINVIFIFSNKKLPTQGIFPKQIEFNIKYDKSLEGAAKFINVVMNVIHVKLDLIL